MEKSPEAFRTISEVAAWLETPAHVLRFWESRFPEISPIKRAGGRRYYRPEDMQLLGGIKQLLHSDGMTIKAVQKKLASEGVGAVCSFSPPMSFAEGPAALQDLPADDPPDALPDALPFVEVRRAAPTPRHTPTLPTRPAAPQPPPFASAPRSAPPSRPPMAPPSPMRAPLSGDDSPAIGFFFDDSLEDDSVLAPTTAPAPAPLRFRPVLSPLTDLSPDPDDHTPLLGPVLPLPARLRALTPQDIAAAGSRSRLVILTRRLAALRPPAE